MAADQDVDGAAEVELGDDALLAGVAAAARGADATRTAGGVMPAFRMTIVAYAVQALIATLMVEDLERRAAARG